MRGLRPVLVASLVVSSAVGCTPDSEILCGRWQSRAPITGNIDGTPEASILPHGVELFLGHFDRDVAGTVRFYDRQFGEGDDCGINDVPSAGCGCTYLDNGIWRNDDRRFTFAVLGEEACTAERFCVPPGVPLPPAEQAQEATDRSLEFDLLLVDDDTLVGTVRYRTTDPKEPVQPVVLVRLGCQSCEQTLGVDIETECQCEPQ